MERVRENSKRGKLRSLEVLSNELPDSRKLWHPHSHMTCTLGQKLLSMIHHLGHKTWSYFLCNQVDIRVIEDSCQCPNMSEERKDILTIWVWKLTLFFLRKQGLSSLGMYIFQQLLPIPPVCCCCCCCCCCRHHCFYSEMCSNHLLYTYI